MNKNAYGVIGVCIAVALWQALAVLKAQPAIVPIEKIAEAFFMVIADSSLPRNLTSTMRILFSGVSVAAVFGIFVAIACSYDWRILSTVSPIVGMLRNIPSITLFPILLVIYGVGDASRVFVIFWTAFPPILLSSIRGMSSVDDGLIEAARALGMTKAQAMMYVQIPLSMPQIVNGIRIGTGSGFVAIVVAEMLGATSGIGYMVLWTTNSFRYPETYVYILLIGIMGTAVNSIMEAAESRCERMSK